MNSECTFCNEYIAPQYSEFHNRIGVKLGISSRILHESDNWYVVPSLGCLVPGYVLMICKQHYLSAASMPLELLIEMQRLKNTVEKILMDKTGCRCICFEHGVTDSSFTGANSVDHVHLHLIPFPSLAWPIITNSHNLDGFESIDSYEQLFISWVKNKPKTYLFFQDVDGRIFYKPDASGFPSQFFRMCISLPLNATRWDWKKEYYEENFKKTIMMFNIRGM